MEEATTLPQSKRKTAKTSSDLETKSTSTTTTTTTREDTPKLARGGTHERGRPFIRTFQTSDQTGKTLFRRPAARTWRSRTGVVRHGSRHHLHQRRRIQENSHRMQTKPESYSGRTEFPRSRRRTLGGAWNLQHAIEDLKPRSYASSPRHLQSPGEDDHRHGPHLEVSPHLLPNTQRNLLAWKSRMGHR